ncbi:hypothetical protein POP12_005 [Pectobacterium phage POP12]|nr:hypothetical protein POP12_005 [Pectobacterium phage POP12]
MSPSEYEMKMVKDVRSLVLSKLKNFKKEEFFDSRYGICSNLDDIMYYCEDPILDGVNDLEEIFDLQLIFEELGLDPLYPVEQSYAIDKGIECSNLHVKYNNQSNKWDIETNPYAEYRHKLLDMLIEYLENDTEYEDVQ